MRTREIVALNQSVGPWANIQDLYKMRQRLPKSRLEITTIYAASVSRTLQSIRKPVAVAFLQKDALLPEFSLILELYAE